MRILNLFITLLILASMVSCSEDYEPKPTEGISELAGVWDLAALNYTSITTLEMEEEVINTTYNVGIGKDLAMNLEFKKNPNEMISSGDYTIFLTAETLGVKTELELENQNFFTSGTWERDGDVLTVINGLSPEPQKATIKIEEGKMTLEVNITQVVDHEVYQNRHKVSSTFEYVKR